MVTKGQAAQQGTDFAGKWNEHSKTIDGDAIKDFIQQLTALDAQDKGATHPAKWAELKTASEGLTKNHVLPDLEVTGSKTPNQRNCRIVGATADGDKNAANDDLVVAIGRKGNHPTKAENIVILGQDGKFYQAQQVKGGYVKTGEPIANNSDELERKYKNHELPVVKNDGNEKPGDAKHSRTKCEHGGGISVTSDANGPTKVEITHSQANLPNEQFSKVDGKWQALDREGNVDKSARQIKDITVDEKGQPQVEYEDHKTRTFMLSERVVAKDEHRRVTSVTRADGCSFHIQYKGYPGNDIEAYGVPENGGGYTTFRRYPGQVGYTENGSGGGSYYTDAPVVNPQTGQVRVRDSNGDSHNYT